MEKAAVQEGFYKPPHFDQEYPRIQISTIKELLSGNKPSLPPLLKYTNRLQKKDSQQDLIKS